MRRIVTLHREADSPDSHPDVSGGGAKADTESLSQLAQGTNGADALP